MDDESSRNLKLKWAAATLGSFSLLGALITGVYVNSAGLVVISDHVPAVWFATLAAFHCLLAYLRYRYFQWSMSKLALFATALCLGAAVICCAAYAIGGLLDATLWALALIVACALSLAAPKAGTLCGKPRKVEEDGVKVEPYAPTTCERLSQGCCGCALFTAMLFGLLLIGGATQLSWAATSFPPQRSLSAIELRDGRPQTIAWRCAGPDTSNYTVVTEADGSHGQADFWPLQEMLVKEHGIRTCVFDKPGLGWSSDYYAHQPGPAKGDYSPSAYSIYPQVLDLFGDGPFILAGWGGGGPIVHRVARSSDLGGDKVAGIVLLGVGADDIEYQVIQQMDELTDEETNSLRTATINSRLGLFSVIRGFLAPWGLLSVIVPYNPDGYALPSRYDEYRSFYASSDRTWTIQQFTLAAALESSYDPTLGEMGEPLPARVKARAVYQYTPVKCRDGQSKKSCDEDKRRSALYQQHYMAVANASVTAVNGTTVCEPCQLDFVYAKPQAAVDAIVALVAELQA